MECFRLEVVTFVMGRQEGGSCNVITIPVEDLSSDYNSDSSKLNWWSKKMGWPVAGTASAYPEKVARKWSGYYKEKGPDMHYTTTTTTRRKTRACMEKNENGCQFVM